MTPATLIGILTILGYSLYDTVVVFDKVRENVRDLKSSTTKTYSEAANLAVNQVLVRSINTTIIGVLPVAALLFAGAVILGEGPLKDLALALFVGMVSGAYSSIFIATPMLAQLKEREPEMKKLAARVAARRAKEAEGRRIGADRGQAAIAAGARADADRRSTRSCRAEPTRSSRTMSSGGRARCRIQRAEPSTTPSWRPQPQRAHRHQDQPGDQHREACARPLSDGAAKRPSLSTSPAASGSGSPGAGGPGVR